MVPGTAGCEPRTAPEEAEPGGVRRQPAAGCEGPLTAVGCFISERCPSVQSGARTVRSRFTPSLAPNFSLHFVFVAAVRVGIETVHFSGMILPAVQSGAVVGRGISQIGRCGASHQGA